MTPATAFSYVRFSTPDQAKGDSLRRQTKRAVEYCAAHGLTLDTQLSLHDLGVSAFRGSNADVGTLGEFLNQVKAGKVPRGSHLLIESFDRMSRDHAFDANIILSNILQQGIVVDVIRDGGQGEQYSVEILRKDPFKMFAVLVELIRAHSESEHKSNRLKPAWENKRAKAAHGVVMTRIVPGWLRVPDGPVVNGEVTRAAPVVIPERAAVVKEIFESFVRGEGKHSITRRLNERREPTFNNGGRRTAGKWYPSYVIKVLRARTAIGVFTPSIQVHDPVTRKMSRVKQTPVPGYYPAVVDVTTFERVQALLDSSSDKYGTRPAQHGVMNLLATLARCPACGSTMTRVNKNSTKNPTKAGAPKLVCTLAKSQRKNANGEKECGYHGVSIPLIERALVEHADELTASAPDTDATLPVRLEELKQALAQKEAAILRVSATIWLEDSPPRALVEQIHKAEAERDALAAAIEALQRKVTQGESSFVARRVDNLRSALKYFGGMGDVADANAALRECFERIVVDYRTGTLECHWRHGPPPSVIRYKDNNNESEKV